MIFVATGPLRFQSLDKGTVLNAASRVQTKKFPVFLQFENEKLERLRGLTTKT